MLFAKILFQKYLLIKCFSLMFLLHAVTFFDKLIHHINLVLAVNLTLPMSCLIFEAGSKGILKRHFVQTLFQIRFQKLLFDLELFMFQAVILRILLAQFLSFLSF